MNTERAETIEWAVAFAVVVAAMLWIMYHVANNMNAAREILINA